MIGYYPGTYCCNIYCDNPELLTDRWGTSTIYQSSSRVRYWIQVDGLVYFSILTIYNTGSVACKLEFFYDLETLTVNCFSEDPTTRYQARTAIETLQQYVQLREEPLEY